MHKVKRLRDRVFFSQLLKYNDDAADIVNDDAGYVADDDGRNRFISTTTVGPRAFKLSSGLPALPGACASPQVIKIIVIIVILSLSLSRSSLSLSRSSSFCRYHNQDHRHDCHFVVFIIKISVIIILIISHHQIVAKLSFHSLK